MIVTTFAQFENAINTLGCVYDTIDQRYYHNNANGGDQYQNVDLQPGYQCLNGNAAESFVSYRHTDTSQVRDARDQSFLLAAKKQYGPALSSNIGRFERIFGRTVTTDAGLRSQTEILNLASLLITAAGLHVRQVHFFASPLPSGDLTAHACGDPRERARLPVRGSGASQAADGGHREEGQASWCARAPAADPDARVERCRREGGGGPHPLHRRIPEGAGVRRNRVPCRRPVHTG